MHEGVEVSLESAFSGKFSGAWESFLASWHAARDDDRLPVFRRTHFEIGTIGSDDDMVAVGIGGRRSMLLGVVLIGPVDPCRGAVTAVPLQGGVVWQEGAAEALATGADNDDGRVDGLDELLS